MPDKRRHRGANPQDQTAFGLEMLSRLGRAVADYCLLLTKGYAPKSALKLVGDHFSLTDRQRSAVMRAACSDSQLQNRRQIEVPAEDVASNPIFIDGYNILITTEAAISGAPIFRCCDHTYRDLASVHGTYRKVEETIPAIKIIAQTLQELKVSHARFLFDRPVSNSGRLKILMQQFAEQNNLPWQIELSQNPDKDLIAAKEIVATADSNILDHCTRWTNLTACIIVKLKKTPWLIDLS